jgi:hypothetical protein
MKISQENIDSMASNIESGKVLIALHDSHERGYTFDRIQRAWSAMTSADVECASALIGEITNMLRPKLKYSRQGIADNNEFTYIF